MASQELFWRGEKSYFIGQQEIFDLAETMEDALTAAASDCPNAQAVIDPYVALARDLQAENPPRLGTNNTFDVTVAANALFGRMMVCPCDEATPCPFAGVDKVSVYDAMGLDPRLDLIEGSIIKEFDV